MVSGSDRISDVDAWEQADISEAEQLELAAPFLLGEGDHIPGKKTLKDKLVKINKFNY